MNVTFSPTLNPLAAGSPARTISVRCCFDGFASFRLTLLAPVERTVKRTGTSLVVIFPWTRAFLGVSTE